jgi:protein-S-isoprenylcysteine O-methyltransferase Ste14
MALETVYRTLVLIGIIVYGMGLIIPNYLRAKENKRQKKETNPEENNTNMTPAGKIEKVRFIGLLIFWIFNLLVMFQILGVYSFLPIELFLPVSDIIQVIIGAISLGLIVIGTMFSLLAGLALGKHFLFPDEAVKKDWKLCKTGIYSKIRHPFYTYMILSLYSLPFMLLCWPLWIFSPFLTIIQYKIAKLEESLMQKVFGAEFTEYKKSTRMFI